ncbi:MAG: hypothetical protein N3E49_01610 [Bacteroidia bacterium]|nr:hypothetical protein [Bacteroidia bacterium]
MKVLLCTGVLMGFVWSQKAQCILVKLKHASDLTADNALHPSWEEKSVRLKLPDNLEESFIDAEDEATDRSIAECFTPQLKLITERYTYIISLACQNLIAYQNTSPYKPSPRRVQSPISFTEDFRYFLEKSIEKYMKVPPRRLYAEYSLAYIPPTQGVIKYEELDFLLNQSQLMEEEDDDEDPEPDLPSESPSDWMGEELEEADGEND